MDPTVAIVTVIVVGVAVVACFTINRLMPFNLLPIVDCFSVVKVS